MFRQAYHILSDLHLEHRPKITSLVQFANTYKQLGRKGYNVNDQENKNRILILAGDIGWATEKNYWLFLKDCANRYKHVICIPGNHEYYDENYNVDQTNELIAQKSKEINDETGNFHYLINNTVTLDGVKYIGTTLWSQLDSSHKRDIVSGLNDFNYIKMKFCKNLTFEQYNEFHRRDLDWLLGEIHKTILETNPNFVVITHHLPSDQLVHPKYKNPPYNTINSAFSTNLDHIIQGKLWIAGHTHIPMIKVINGTPIVVNPFGYANECLYAGMNETIIEFE
jgi:predicted MPP superfamily phosphohydrolase